MAEMSRSPRELDPDGVPLTERGAGGACPGSVWRRSGRTPGNRVPEELPGPLDGRRALKPLKTRGSSRGVRAGAAALDAAGAAKTRRNSSESSSRLAPSRMTAGVDAPSGALQGPSRWPASPRSA